MLISPCLHYTWYSQFSFPFCRRKIAFFVALTCVSWIRNTEGFFNASLERGIKSRCTRYSIKPSYLNWPSKILHDKSLHIFHSIPFWPDSTLYSLHRILLQTNSQSVKYLLFILCLTIFFVYAFFAYHIPSNQSSLLNSLGITEFIVTL